MAQPTIQQNFDLAVRQHQAGRLQEAERLYRQILAQQPDHTGAIHYLGVMAHQQGRNDVAIDLIRKAIALKPDFFDAYSNLGNIFKAVGQFDQAIALYRQALALKPDHVLYRDLVGALISREQLDEAIAVVRQAIALRPSDAQANSRLGDLLQAKGQLDESAAGYRRAIALDPNLAEAYMGLGNALDDKGQRAEAIAAYRSAIAIRPGYAEAHNNLGLALQASGLLDEAIVAYRQAMMLKPGDAEAPNNLGNALKAKGQIDEAIAAYRAAITRRPSYATAHHDLGIALLDQGRFNEAIAAFHQAIAIDPKIPETHNNLGNALSGNVQLDEAIAAYRQAISLRPSYAEAYSNLGVALKDEGRLDEAVAALRQATALAPADPMMHSTLLFVLAHHPAYDETTIARESRNWAMQHAQQLSSESMPHVNSIAPERRLKIGYLSRFLCDNADLHDLLPLLSNHDHSCFEIYLYSDVAKPDQSTARVRGFADHWYNTLGLSDAQLAQLIRDDQIDIAIVHSPSHRLLAVARKPAPIQITWLYSASSTGLETIDYRISDPFVDPLDWDVSRYSEKTFRLPETAWCYDPLVRSLSVNPLPAIHNGYITFGSLNRLAKINDAVLALWSDVLKAIPGARLCLLVDQGAVRQRPRDTFASFQIDPERIWFVPRQSGADYLKSYHQIDIALDTFPYNGHNTTRDALWMGVPVITLAHRRPVGRVGVSLLSNLRMAELIAQTPEAFVSAAKRLSDDLPALAALRTTLRQRLEFSPLMDAPRFARNIEAAYRRMWRDWCDLAVDNV